MESVACARTHAVTSIQTNASHVRLPCHSLPRLKIRTILSVQLARAHPDRLAQIRNLPPSSVLIWARATVSCAWYSSARQSDAFASCLAFPVSKFAELGPTTVKMYQYMRRGRRGRRQDRSSHPVRPFLECPGALASPLATGCTGAARS